MQESYTESAFATFFYVGLCGFVPMPISKAARSTLNIIIFILPANSFQSDHNYIFSGHVQFIEYIKSTSTEKLQPKFHICFRSLPLIRIRQENVSLGRWLIYRSYNFLTMKYMFIFYISSPAAAVRRLTCSRVLIVSIRFHLTKLWKFIQGPSMKRIQSTVVMSVDIRFLINKV